MKIKVLLVHPGTQYAYHLARQLSKRNLLLKFCTCTSFKESSLIPKVLPKKMKKRLSNRIAIGIKPDELFVQWTPDLFYYLEGFSSKEEEERIKNRNQRFQEKIPDELIKEADIIIGFDTSSWLIAKTAKKYGKIFILDQSIAHPVSKEKIYANIRNSYPEWEQEIPEKNDQYIVLERKEHVLANIIMVASSFTKKTLISNGVSSEKIYINPYGVDSIKFSQRKKTTTKRNLKFVFIGTVCARKGIPLLLEAWGALKPSGHELYIIGPISKRIPDILSDNNNIYFLDKMAHNELSFFLKDCDVLLFPSFFEGFGLVVLEAMACGLPVVTTDATVGRDIIENGQDGFVINVGDKHTLIQKIKYFMDHPENIDIMGEKARKKAELYSWERYGANWEETITTALKY